MIRKKKKAKKVCVHIDIPIYNAWMIVSINQTNEEFRRSFIKHRGQMDKTAIDQTCKMVERESEFTIGRTAHQHGNVIVRLYSDLKTPTDYNTLVHELFHATDFILDYRGLTLVDGSDEAYAYLIGYLTEKIMEAYL